MEYLGPEQNYALHIIELLKVNTRVEQDLKTCNK